MSHFDGRIFCAHLILYSFKVSYYMTSFYYIWLTNNFSNFGILIWLWRSLFALKFSLKLFRIYKLFDSCSFINWWTQWGEDDCGSPCVGLVIWPAKTRLLARVTCIRDLHTLARIPRQWVACRTGCGAWGWGGSCQKCIVNIVLKNSFAKMIV